VVEGRDEHLDVVVRDDLHPLEKVLLGQKAAAAAALRRGGEAVDELVDARCAQRAGRGAGQQISSCQSHVRPWA
jgi:hypothetical protein